MPQLSVAPVIFSDSAGNHEIPEADQRYAIAIPIRAMPSGDKKVFHAMDLGPKYRPFLEEA